MTATPETSAPRQAFASFSSPGGSLSCLSIRRNGISRRNQKHRKNFLQYPMLRIPLGSSVCSTGMLKVFGVGGKQLKTKTEVCAVLVQLVSIWKESHKRLLGGEISGQLARTWWHYVCTVAQHLLHLETRELKSRNQGVNVRPKTTR